MRYDDASQTGSSAADNAPVARPDVDAIAPGSFSPATGNAITGAGTTSGLAGADAPANGSRIVEVHGAGGPTAGSGNAFQANGQYGVLNMDAQGNFTYVRNPGTPDGVQDVFGYTLADAKGATSSTTLTMDIGGIASAAATAATQGIVNLPAGVEMSDIKVNGRDLVIQMPDGTQMVIPGGAVFVPQLVIGDVQVPSSNLAALLIDSEPKPAAGSLQSSGGNFDVPVPPLDPGAPLGDLIPPTELAFTPPEVREVNQFIDKDVDAGTAFAQLDDDAQAGGIAGGVGDDPGGSTASGFLPGSNGDGNLEWALLSSGAPAGFSYQDGPDGSVLVFQDGNANAVLRIDIDPDTGAYTVTQLGPITHPAGGDENNVEIVINYTVTDEDGDDDTGSLTINIDDDTPVAQNDTDALVGKATSTDGNVITGVGTTSGNAGIDSPGADGLGAPGNPNDGVNGFLAGTSGSFSAPGTTVNGQFGSLTMDANGHYVYTRFAESRAGGTDVFTYRIIDGDGDETTATLTITVPADPVPQPNVATAIVDDDGLPAGNHDSQPGDDVVPDNDGDNNESTFRGTLTANFGGDVPGSFNLAAMNLVANSTGTVGQETVHYSWDAGTRILTATITASPIDAREGTALFQVHLDAGGQFDVTLLQNVLQTAPGAGDPPAFENDATAALTFTAVDSNGDSTNSTLTITFDDDIPVAIIPPPPGEGGTPTPLVSGLVDEDDLQSGNHDNAPGDDDPVDASGDLNPLTTGDGPGSLDALFKLGADAAGAKFFLNTNTAGLEGQGLTSDGHALIYDVNVNTGVLTAHADLNGNGNFDAGETIFTLTVNQDGSWVFELQGALDHAAPPPGTGFENNINIDLSASIVVVDADGDSAIGATGAFVVTVDDDMPRVQLTENQPSLTVDETDLSINASASFAGAFASAFGADGPGTITYALGITGGNGTPSGLTDVATGLSIVLVDNAGVIEGHVGDAAGAVAFTVSIDSAGVVTLDQLRALTHPDMTNPDDNVTLGADNLITVTATVTDNDGDSASAVLDIGQNLNFHDDGPSVTLNAVAEPSLTVDETNFGGDAGPTSFAGLFNFSFGADGPASSDSIQFNLGVNPGSTGIIDTLSGDPVLLFLEGGQVVGRAGGALGPIVLVISVDADGNVSLDQQRSVIHADPSNPNDSITFLSDNLITLSATVTDKDGDTATIGTPIAIAQDFNFLDDGPSITVSGTEPSLTVDESFLVINAGPTSFASAFTPVFGNDGPLDANHDGIADAGAVTYALGITGGNGTNSGLVDTATHEAVNLVNNGGVIEGRTATTNQLVFTVTVNSVGQVTLDQLRAVVHPNTANPDDSVTLAADNLITLTATATDGDGDQASATLNIGQNLNFEDDGPSANNDTDVTSNVTDTADGNVITGVGTTEGPANHDIPGADGFGSITNLVGFNGSTDSSSAGGGFDVNGQFGTLHMNVDGSYVYTRTGGAGGAIDTFTYTYVDGDGDPASATLTITLADNTPVAGTVNVGLDDDALANGNPGGIGDDPDSVNATGTLPGSGGDAPLTFGVLLTGAPAGFTYVSGGAGIVLVKQGATTVLTVTVNSTTGAYSVVQNAPIVHAAGGDENNQAFAITYTVTDADTDVANGTINISVDDDTPTVSANAGVQLDDDALAGGNPGGIGDDANATNTSGTLAHSYGADGAGSIAYLTTGAPAGFSYALQGNGDLWVMQGANHVLTLTVNSSTGAYTVTQNAPIVHAAGGDENNQAFTISYRVTDGDGDTVDGSISVNVDDDTPTVSANAGVQLDDDALAGGNPGGIGDDANATNTSGTLAHSYGADGAGSVAYLTTGAPAGFSYVLQGNGDLWVNQGATHVLTLTVNSSTGAYTVTQVAPIVHAAGSDENNQAFTISYRVTDGDGDTVDGSISVNVDDDTPTVSANAAVQLDDDALAGGNAGGIGDVNPDTANTTGTLAHSYGADGAGSVALLGTGAPGGFTYDTSTPGTLLIKQGATTVITVTVNSTTGAYTVTQNAPIAHPAGGDENDVAFTVNYRVSDSDGDTVDGSIVINVDDDTPTATIVATGANTSLDESVGVQVDSNDTTSASVIALFSGVAAPVGTDTDLPQYATNANAIVASTGSSYGADGAGTTTYSLNVSSVGVDSGLDTTDGQSIFLFKEGNLIVGRVGNASGPAAFAIAIDNTGHISTVEYLSIQHNLNGLNPDDSVSIANGAVTATVTLTDSDGDSVSSIPLAIGSHIEFQDSGPVMTAASNINIQNSGDVAANGTFAYNLGADGASTDNNVISAVTFSAVVNGVTVQTTTPLTQVSEDSHTATFSFSFTYGTGGSSTATENGTITFYKDGSVPGHAAGTYTVDLQDPIAGISLVTVQGGSAPVFYDNEHIGIVQVASNVYMQFTGFSAITGDNPFGFNDAFTGTNDDVHISSTDIGVHGNALQKGEVIDFDFLTSDPGAVDASPQTTVTEAFIQVAQYNGEDLVLVLKLANPATPGTFITRTVIVDSADVLTTNQAGYPTLGANDGLIIIQPNDYLNLPGVPAGYQLAGMQILTSTPSGMTAVSNEVFNFDGNLNAFDNSSATFANATDNDVIKITNIGAKVISTTNQTADLTFNVTVKDGDNDTVTQTVVAHVSDAADSSTPIVLSPAVTTVAPVVLDLNGDGVHFLATDAGVHYDYGKGSVATAWASPQDGILVLDGNHNGTVDSASEFVFGGNGTTDLQALAVYDTNGDGQLSSADAQFANLAVWQDANSNGVADAGEVRSLMAMGIASISLSTDGITYTAANDDVSVAGTGTYTNADGSTGALADAAFSTGTRVATEDQLRSSTAMVSNAALIAAVAAAGLAAAEPLAAKGAGHDGSTDPVVSAVAVNDTSSLAGDSLSSSDAQSSSSTLVGDAPAQHADASSANAPSESTEVAHDNALDAPQQDNSAPAELLQGTDAPAQAEATANPFTADAIQMPAANQLVAQDGGAVAGDNAQHNAVVAQVLADALNGGDSPHIEAALNAVTGGDHAAQAANDALASQGSGAVSNGDMPDLAAFIAAHGVGMVAPMEMHHDAPAAV